MTTRSDGAARPDFAGPSASASSDCPRALPGVNFYAPALPGGGKTVALTFDDGPGASTAAILAILESYRVRATFFNIGEQEAERPADVRAEEEAGFLVANHTWSHPDLTTLSPAEQGAQMDEVIREQRSLTGTSPCELRPPYGDYNSTTTSLARQRHMSIWMWSVDTEDWEAEGSGSSYWVDRIIYLAESEGGSQDHPVVLMHNQAIPMPATVAALPTIIQFFKDNGYTFVDLLGRSTPLAGCGQGPPRRPGSTVLPPGGELEPGQSVASPRAQYHLVMQRDGNLVLLFEGHPLWSSGTQGHGGAHALVERNGDFVVLSRQGRVLWSTGTPGDPGAELEVQSDGNLAVDRAGAVLWSSGTSADELEPGEELEGGWYLQSSASACRLVMNEGGPLSLLAANGQLLWQAGGGGSRAVMQQDGDFVVYSSAGRPVWSTNTAGMTTDALFLSRNGTVFVEAPDGSTAWFR